MRFRRLDVWCRLRYGLGVAGALALSLPCVAADVDSVLVRQQWPWSTDVKVEYNLLNVTAPVNIKVECFNNGVAMPSEDIDSAIIGRTYGLTKADEGIGFFYIDPVKAFGKTQVSLANFTVKLSLSEADAIDAEPIYKIIDLQTKTVQHLSRADFYNDRGQKYGGWETNFAAIGYSPSKGVEFPYTTSLKNVFIWTGVTNNIEYKTTKLVMRRIPAKNKTFMMGANPNDYTRWSSDSFYLETSFSEDYYVGVFELTYRQYELLSGVANSAFAESDWCMPKPVESYHSIRGTPTSWSGWPSNPNAVGSNSFIDKARSNFNGLLFDVPTEAQWEYACRAGTDTMNYSGVTTSSAFASSNDLVAVAWCAENSGTKLHMPGGLRPNAFGLYDCLGNIAELTSALFNMNEMTDSHPPPLTETGIDPIGWSDLEGIESAVNNSKCAAIYRGGCYSRNYTFTRSPCRRENKVITLGWSDHYGMRLWLKAE